MACGGTGGSPVVPLCSVSVLGLDLYPIHWLDTHVPGKRNQEFRAETWRAMEKLYEKGVCRSIGVSNFHISHLEQLQEDCVVTPHVNQVFNFNLREDDVEFLNIMNINRKQIHLLALVESIT
ncbi:uncharacterized protein LOC119771270 isoform 1 [Gallus gallus]|uniref:uncharacterized protein LOC119771270 isoform 1 n=1 Tax=Gallus gallus TaxID=9031 RepID=UPI001CBA048D|nr:uncharacterized protein LOC119771270 isoform 1 [Gallus gallus]